MLDGTTFEYAIEAKKPGGGPKAKPNAPPVALMESKPDGSLRLSLDLPTADGEVPIRIVLEAERVTLQWLERSAEGSLVG